MSYAVTNRENPKAAPISKVSDRPWRSTFCPRCSGSTIVLGTGDRACADLTCAFATGWRLAFGDELGRTEMNGDGDREKARLYAVPLDLAGGMLGDLAVSWPRGTRSVEDMKDQPTEKEDAA